jgi:hypothetical protein
MYDKGESYQYYLGRKVAKQIQYSNVVGNDTGNRWKLTEDSLFAPQTTATTCSEAARPVSSGTFRQAHHDEIHPRRFDITKNSNLRQ